MIAIFMRTDGWRSKRERKAYYVENIWKALAGVKSISHITERKHAGFLKYQILFFNRN